MSVAGWRAGVVIAALMAAGNAARAASHPLVTDILPSGVPLPVPAPTFVLPPDDAGTELLGDAWGARPWLDRHGVRLTAQDVEELWGLTGGGLNRGATYDGMTAMALLLDTNAAFGWHDGAFNISALQIRGRSFTDERLGALNPVSGYDAGRSTRLFEVWYGQGFFGDRLDIRVGSLDLDTEFLVSQNASFFLNASFGWPLSTSSNLYSGGPSWPYSALGTRVKWSPLSALVLMGAVTDDNPTGGPFYSSDGDTQRDASGTRFSLGNGALFVGEAQYWLDLARNLSGKDAPALPGTWKIGGLFDSGAFPDPRYDARGGLLADPDSSGDPREHRGNWMTYVVIDQMIWREKVGSDKTINVFVRATASNATRNRFTREVQAGFTFDELLPGRPDDTFGIAWGVGLYGRRAAQAARDAARFGTATGAPPRPEHHIELTYQAAVTHWLNLQPDVQYFWGVGGGATDGDTGRPIRNAVVTGLNMTTTF
ncbi:porin [Ameyamaea chiangmaiensis NBRC 103196]|uniref:Carbohydrate porin n=1 Tax=Ameyamaea chiangmaiensis TaxID=442969 RepID=A0A850PDL3_9PROT|nr:carbohydrate porin [Ameyamaea chiangmaiensis]MBS4076084.1 carbohydrate porin [Ameyamaea chiangmaiensis]NVN40983.1 carbohydrate porin [Ameyamaea chiangmaiensis]GBQ66965.1 porin [Ameyamaea chiangmaiensis NBRC 103196]